MRIDTLEQIIRMFKSASKDETRPYICGVYVTPKVIYATTGYTAASVKVDDTDIAEDMFFNNSCISLLRSTVIHAKAMKQLRVPTGAYAGFTRPNDNFPLKFLEGNIKKPKNSNKVRLDAKLLFDLVTSMQTTRGKDQNYMIEIDYQPRKECLITLKNNERGIIMPTT